MMRDCHEKIGCRITYNFITILNVSNTPLSIECSSVHVPLLAKRAEEHSFQIVKH